MSLSNNNQRYEQVKQILWPTFYQDPRAMIRDQITLVVPYIHTKCIPWKQLLDFSCSLNTEPFLKHIFATKTLLSKWIHLNLDIFLEFLLAKINNGLHLRNIIVFGFVWAHLYLYWLVWAPKFSNPQVFEKV